MAWMIGKSAINNAPAIADRGVEEGRAGWLHAREIV
jgi:hypothetical protein